MTETTQTRIAKGTPWSARAKLLLVLLVCAAPVVASYLTYYLFQPEGRTNYGELVQPQREVTGLAGTAVGGGVSSLAQLRGKWVMLTIAPAACDKSCQERLYAIRQVRLTTGKDRDRVERLLLVTDDGQIDAALLQAHDGMHVMRVDPVQAARLFSANKSDRAPGQIFIIDPLGNLMMRFPEKADPNRMKKDLSKLLRASRIG